MHCHGLCKIQVLFLFNDAIRLRMEDASMYLTAEVLS
jgi:hypothetical protein